MATSNRPTKNQCRANTDDVHRLGVDSDGNEHYMFAVPLAAWIVDTDGEIRQVQRIPSVGDYVEHVRDVCGWDTVRYDPRTLGEFVADTVDDAARQVEACK